MEREIELLQLQVKALQIDINEIMKLIKELHALQTCSLYTVPKEKKLTPKQRKQVEADAELASLLKLRREAHTRILNKWKESQMKKNQ